jgi:hypothetical protein
MTLLNKIAEPSNSGDLEVVLDDTRSGVAKWALIGGVWTCSYDGFDHALTDEGFIFSSDEWVESPLAYITTHAVAPGHLADLYEAIIAQQIDAEDV